MFSKSVVKYIQSLQQKKFREIHNTFVAEGPKVVEELLKDGHFICRNLYATELWNPVFLPANAELTVVKEHELEKLASYTSPNLVIGEFECRKSDLPGTFNGLNLVLDDIRDPGNFGTIIRTADWFGVKHVICSENCVDMYNPKVVQGTMASLGRVNVVYTDIENFIEKNGSSCLAATLDGRIVSEGDSNFQGFLVIGNESNGVRKSITEKVEKISIKGFGKAESLNAAIAAGILMYALK